MFALLCVFFGSRAARAAEERERYEPEIGGGLIAGVGSAGFVGTLRLGATAWYRPLPNWAFGVEGEVFAVDNGADSYSCGVCLDRGEIVTAFADYRLLPRYPITPFVRAGAGLAHVEVIEDTVLHSRVQPALAVAAGPELRVWHVYLRLRGTITALPAESFWGYGAELGVAF